MKAINVEIKARCTNAAAIRTYLQEHGARFVGEDHQVDTYFNVAAGQLKLREGTIERALIHYDRTDQKGPKRSDVHLTPLNAEAAPALKATLTAALGVKTVVDKHREIYFIDNVKFHLDRVEKLGHFVEVEAIDHDHTRSQASLQAQCEHYLNAFGIRPNDLVADSYSDMILRMTSEGWEMRAGG